MDGVLNRLHFGIFGDEFVLCIITQKFALRYTIPEHIGKQNPITDPIHKVDYIGF